MSNEAKVGAFVAAGLALAALAVFLLGDFTFRRRYALHVLFADAGGLAEKAPVKVSGVEVGKVATIVLEGAMAKVTARLYRDVPVYRDARITVGSTGIIGSKFLQIDQGRPESGRWEPDSVIRGVDPVAMEQALARALGSLQDLLDGLAGKEGKGTPLTRDINASVASLREALGDLRGVTANLDELVADVRPSLTSALRRADGISARLDAILAKADRAATAVDEGKGPVGALLHDEQMKADVKEAVAGVKTALAGLGRFRVYWSYDYRYESALRAGRSDVGLKLVPRSERYYYVGVSNLGNDADAVRARDFQARNRVDALLGFVWNGIDVAAGSIRSGGGARLAWSPWGPLSLFAQAYDFGRDRTFNSRRLRGAQVDVGAQVRLNRLVGVGVRGEDLRQARRGQAWVNVLFEDKDIASLFGLASFGAAGRTRK